MENRNGYSILLNAVRNIAAWRPPFGSSNHPLDIDKVLRTDIVDIISIAQNALVNHENCTTTETVDERDHLRAVNAELVEALGKIASENSQVCSRCDGGGALYADGKPRYPWEEAPTVPCPVCSGSGEVYELSMEDVQDIARAAIARARS